MTRQDDKDAAAQTADATKAAPRKTKRRAKCARRAKLPEEKAKGQGVKTPRSASPSSSELRQSRPVRAVAKYLRFSAQKGRLVVDQIRGKKRARRGNGAGIQRPRRRARDHEGAQERRRQRGEQPRHACRRALRAARHSSTRARRSSAGSPVPVVAPTASTSARATSR